MKTKYYGPHPVFPAIPPPLDIADPVPGCVLVYGSNLQGINGAGAAKDAEAYYGAAKGVGNGRRGMAYAIPTKATPYSHARPFASIAGDVSRFIGYAQAHAELKAGVWFLVTRVGCGRAGIADEDMATMFQDAPVNCIMPEAWREHLRGINGEEWIAARHWHCREGNGR
jgi:hypothetical protein